MVHISVTFSNVMLWAVIVLEVGLAETREQDVAVSPQHFIREVSQIVLACASFQKSKSHTWKPQRLYYKYRSCIFCSSRTSFFAAQMTQLSCLYPLTTDNQRILSLEETDWRGGHGLDFYSFISFCPPKKCLLSVTKEISCLVQLLSQKFSLLLAVLVCLCCLV